MSLDATTKNTWRKELLGGNEDEALAMFQKLIKWGATPEELLQAGKTLADHIPNSVIATVRHDLRRGLTLNEAMPTEEEIGQDLRTAVLRNLEHIRAHFKPKEE